MKQEVDYSSTLIWQSELIFIHSLWLKMLFIQSVFHSGMDVVQFSYSWISANIHFSVIVTLHFEPPIHLSVADTCKEIRPLYLRWMQLQ